MKGKKCFGLLLVLSIIFGLSLSAFSDVNAITITTNVVSTGNYWNTGTDLRCTQDYQGTVSTITANQHGECNIPTQARPIYIRNIYKNTQINTTEGNFYTFFLGYQTSDLAEQTIWNMNVPNDDWIIASWEEVTSDQMLDLCYTWYSNSSGYYCGTLESVQGWKSTYYQVTLIAKHDGNTTLMLGNPSGSPRSLLIVDAGQISMSSIYEYKAADAAEKMNEKDNEDRDNIESQQSDIDSDSSDLGSDAESATSTLSGNISSIIGAFSTDATDCIIPVNTGNLDLNNLNICSMPSEFRSMTNNISSIVITVAVLWTSYSIIRQFLGIYESFLAGGRS